MFVVINEGTGKYLDFRFSSVNHRGETTYVERDTPTSAIAFPTWDEAAKKAEEAYCENLDYDEVQVVEI